MSAGDVASGEHQVRHIDGVQAVERNAERRRTLVVLAQVSVIPERIWMGVIRGTARVRDDGFEVSNAPKFELGVHLGAE